jgi:uncharacterized membrane protein
LFALLGTACARDEHPEIPALRGTRYLPARRVVQTFCAPCHTSGGHNPRQAEAYRDLHLDSYDEIARRAFLVQKALEIHGAGADMPPRAAAQPAFAERQLLLSWIGRGCPNTPDGH